MNTVDKYCTRSKKAGHGRKECWTLHGRPEKMQERQQKPNNNKKPQEHTTAIINRKKKHSDDSVSSFSNGEEEEEVSRTKLATGTRI